MALANAGLPLMQTVQADKVAEIKTLRGMMGQVLARRRVLRVIVVADRGAYCRFQREQSEAELRHFAMADDRAERRRCRADDLAIARADPRWATLPLPAARSV